MLTYGDMIQRFEALAHYRAKMQRRSDLLSDAFEPYITQLLKSRAPNSWQEYAARIRFQPLYSRVVTSIAGDPYVAGVSHSFNGDDTAPLLERVLYGARSRGAEAARDTWIRFINRLSLITWAHRSAVVLFEPRGGVIRPRIFAPHVAIVIGEDFEFDHVSRLESATAVLIRLSDSATGGYRIWTRTEIASLDSSGKVISTEANPIANTPHPLPFLRVFAEAPHEGEYASVAGEPLAHLALAAAYEETELAVAVEMLDPVAVVRGLDPGGKVQLSPFSPLTAPVDGTDRLTFAAPPTAHSIERRESLAALLKRIEASYYQIPGSLTAGGEATQSGVARRIATKPLLEQRNRWSEIVASMDASALEALFEYSALWLRSGIASGTAHVAPVAQELYLDPVERGAEIRADIALGLASPIDAIAERDRITREEASAVYTQNLIERDQGGGNPAVLIARLNDEKQGIENGTLSPVDLLAARAGITPAEARIKYARNIDERNQAADGVLFPTGTDPGLPE